MRSSVIAPACNFIRDRAGMHLCSSVSPKIEEWMWNSTWDPFHILVGDRAAIVIHEVMREELMKDVRP